MASQLVRPSLVGFDALYMTGFYSNFTPNITASNIISSGTSLSRIGWPDLGLATANDMVANASLIAKLNPPVPLISDADTAYSGSIAVARTVTQYIQAGVVAFHLEDQVQTKRCGHLLGKELASQDEFVSQIKAAAEARKRANSDIVIIARTYDAKLDDEAGAGAGVQDHHCASDAARGSA